MNPYDFYITEDEYKTAADNGISYNTLNRRVRCLGWDKQRALTQKVQNQKPKVNVDQEYLKLAEKNGISRTLFYQRMRRDGLTAKQAATKQKSNPADYIQKAVEKRRFYPKELIALAESNGVSYNTFKARVLNGWSLEKAATTPKMSYAEIGRRNGLKAKETLRRKYGDTFGPIHL